MQLIASLAGVSRSTVSFVLNDDLHIAIPEQTRERVKKIAQDVGYQTAALERAIRNPLRHIGFAEAEPQRVESTMFSDLVQGVREQAYERQYTMLFEAVPTIRNLEDWKPTFERLMYLYKSRLVEGLIIDQQQMLMRSRVELVKQGVPVVMVNGGPVVDDSLKTLPHFSVCFDDAAGARAAITHLLELGHRRIAHIRRPVPSPYTSFPISALQNTYRSTLLDAGIVPNATWQLEGDPLNRDSTEHAIDTLFNQAPAPTAIFAGDDLIAIMAMNALRRRGLRVPEDVSVVGYGNWRQAVIVAEPRLTTVNVPLRENGRLAANMLLDLIEGNPPKSQHVALEPQLVVRESTARASNN